MEQIIGSLPQYVITGIIDRFDGTHAIIVTQDKQTLLWPIKNLPDDIKEGEVVKLKLTTDKLETQNQEQAVKDLLNQILKKD